MDKRKISGDIPFSFLEQMGHNTRAMEQFFDLQPDEREELANYVSLAESPQERIDQVLKSLAYREDW